MSVATIDDTQIPETPGNYYDPFPMLLNFLQHAPEYLCDEEEWFRYLEGWE